MLHAQQSKIIDDTKAWIRQVVIGEQLCPFAHDVFSRLAVVVESTNVVEQLALALAEECTRLLNAGPVARPTSVLVLTELGRSFDDYLDIAEYLNDCLSVLELSDEFQIATFHPDYQFEGSEAEDPANWTNRSPWPMFHILRTADVASAREAHPDIDSIPARNIEHFRALGLETVRQFTDQ